ncbi:MAG: endonuclease/exonuclease/phosphatase family protein [Bacteriovorax sp.]|nr:endonuclease/exonuclease/phosphatase family protein [Bacteriovorax sp.]
MNFHFSSQAKKNISDFLNLTLILIIGGVLISLLGRYHWFFNLFDQFWSLYLVVSAILLLVFLFFKKNAHGFISLCVFIVCASVFYKVDSHSNLKFNSSFKIYYQNINSSNSSLTELSQNIKKADVEIVTLVEATPEIENVITRNLRDYSNHFSLARDDNFGFLILSKINFKLEEIHERIGIPVYIKFFVEKYNMKIYLLHLPPPLWREAWETQKETLALIAREINRNKNQSFLMIGDFNMTTSSSQFQDFYRQLNPKFYSQELFSPGTWPSFMPGYLSLPIDHVLSNRNFEMEIGIAAGSDHKSIVVRIGAITNFGQKKAQ